MATLKQSWFTLSCLQLSGALSLPVIMIGYYLGQHYPPAEVLLQVAIGNAVLFGLAAIYMTIISRKKMVTIEFARYLFGPQGTYLCAAGMALSLLGWSAIQLQLIASVTAYPGLTALLSALLIYCLTSRDLTYLAGVNKLLLPSVGLSLGYLLWSSPQTAALMPLPQTLPFRLGLMMVIMAGSGLVFDLPTFYRHAATTKDGLVSLLVIFMFALPLIEGLGVYLASHYNGGAHWLQNFISSFSLPALVFLMISGLLGTCLNLYSAALVINRTLGLPYRKTLALCCLLAALLAKVDLEHGLAVFLELINLNAEIVTVLILSYLLFKGSKLPQPNSAQKRTHQTIFYLSLGYAAASKLFKISLLNDLFLDTALISCFLMSAYYCQSLIKEKRYAIS